MRRPTYEELSRQLEALQTEIVALRQAAHESRLTKAFSKTIASPARESADTSAVPEEGGDRSAAVETARRPPEMQYRSLVDNSLVGIFTTSLEGRIHYVNDALARMFGFDTAEELMAKVTAIRYKRPEDRDRLIQRLQMEGSIDSYEVDLVNRTGAVVTALLCATLEGNEIYGLLTDITARKTVETALQESEERYRRLLESNPDAVFCHREGTIILANPAAVKLFGASSREDLIGRDLFSMVHPDDAAEIRKRRDRVVETGQSTPLMTTQFVRIDGREIDVEVCGTLVYLDNLPAVQTAARDISARVRAEAALRESEKRLGLITNHLTNAMVYQIVVQPDGTRFFSHVSDTVRQLHELSPYDVMADPTLLYRQVLPEYADELWDRGQRAFRDLESFRYEFQCQLPSGKKRWFELVSTPGKPVDGNVVFNGIEIDITERKRTEQMLRESQEQFQRLFTHANVGIALHELVCDPGGDAVDYIVTDVNPAYTRILNLDRREVVGHRAGQLYGGDGPPYLDVFAAVATGGTPTSFETYFPPVDRHFRVVVYSPQQGSFATIFDDITDGKRAEQELRESLAYNEVLFGESHIPHVVLDPASGRFTDCNPAAVAIYRYAGREEVIGKSPVDVSTPTQYDGTASADAAAHHIQQALEKGAHRFEWRHQRPDGTIWEAEVYLMSFTYQNRILLQFTLQDITERKEAEQALADSERRLADIIEFLPDPTWVIDTEGRVIAWNRALEDMTGIKKGVILGKGGYAHAVPFYGESRPTLANLVLSRDAYWEKRYVHLKERDGMLIASESFHPQMGSHGRYLSSTAARLFDAQGNVVGAIQSVRDITDAKQAERERERLIAELQEALERVRTLSGMLPICANCKKIRDDKGYWNQIESYIRDHTHAEFSHSICPDCARKLYGV